MSKEQKYISYFQSCITIGIMSSGTNSREAGNKAKTKLLNPNGVNHCFFEQSDFKLAWVEKWKPEMCLDDVAPEGMSFKFAPSDQTKNIIATRLQKNVGDLNEDDYQQFVKESIQKSLSLSDNPCP